MKVTLSAYGKTWLVFHSIFLPGTVENWSLCRNNTDIFKSATLKPLARPDFLCYLGGALVLRGEEKAEWEDHSGWLEIRRYFQVIWVIWAYQVRKASQLDCSSRTQHNANLYTSSSSQSAFMLESRVYQIWDNVLRTLLFLHNKGYVHRDLRWPNIIKDENGNLRIIDLEHSGLEGEAGYRLSCWPIELEGERK